MFLTITRTFQLYDMNRFTIGRMIYNAMNDWGVFISTLRSLCLPYLSSLCIHHRWLKILTVVVLNQLIDTKLYMMRGKLQLVQRTQTSSFYRAYNRPSNYLCCHQPQKPASIDSSFSSLSTI